MKRLFKISLGLLIVVAVLLTVVWFTGRDSNLKVYFFDIGQGDGMLIRTPTHQNIVIDGGPDNTFITKLGQALPFYDRTIDLMVLSHAHDDHLFGLVEVLKRYKVKEVLYSGALHTTDAYLEWLSLIKEKEIPLKIARAGQTFIFNEVEFKVIYPFTDLTNQKMENLNNSSVVNRLVYGQIKILFMGDSEVEGEKEIINQAREGIESQVIKLGHHGSDTSSTEDLLKLVKPIYGIIQVGEDNKFGHPARRVLRRLERLGIQVFRNDLEGDIVLETDGQSLIFR
ncbi:MAG TPA: MBL fold metallo-hydrolase [Patescibacteria group bacterium]|nr:MBL fold metallo-hydrolase [Patescibacteria group bacterium]